MGLDTCRRRCRREARHADGRGGDGNHQSGPVPHLGATSPTGGASLLAAIRREWIDNRFIDFSLAANRRKFWNADGSPVDLGAEGRVDGVRPAYDLYTGTPGDYLDGFNRGYAEAPAVNDTWGLGLSLDPLPFA